MCRDWSDSIPPCSIYESFHPLQRLQWNDQSRTKALQVKFYTCPWWIFPNKLFRHFVLHLQLSQSRQSAVLSILNRRALRAPDCKMSRYSSHYWQSHTRGWKQAFCGPQTNVMIVNSRMGAGPDHYLEVIKPLSSMSAAEQLLCHLARAVQETDCQRGAAEPPVDIKAKLTIF